MRVLLYLCWLKSLTKKSYIDIRVIPTGKGVYFHPGTWHNGVYVAPEHSPATFLTRQGRVHARVSASWASEVSQLCPCKETQRKANKPSWHSLFPLLYFFSIFIYFLFLQSIHIYLVICLSTFSNMCNNAVETNLTCACWINDYLPHDLPRSCTQSTRTQFGQLLRVPLRLED